MAFQTEKQLVDRAASQLPLRKWVSQENRVLLYQDREIRGLFGVPDLVVAGVSRAAAPSSLRSIAFEMKLSDWRRGLAQAFRYRAFAQRAYLVVDEDHIQSAVANSERFVRSNIGLIGVHSHGGFIVYHEPCDEPPYSERLSKSFEEIVRAHLQGKSSSKEKSTAISRRNTAECGV